MKIGNILYLSISNFSLSDQKNLISGHVITRVKGGMASNLLIYVQIWSGPISISTILVLKYVLSYLMYDIDNMLSP